MNAIQYSLPENWIKYRKEDVFKELTDAKAAIQALKTIPFQRRWVEELQKIQLKMEVAGTSKIEGADFAGNELDVALRAETAEQLHTRSQRQALAALKAYKWIIEIPDIKPIDAALICEVHRLIVTDCDEDHCGPGRVRGPDQNVTFGVPRHRGAVGGKECQSALERLAAQFQGPFQEHDLLIQALALHYHFASIHPFSDGNGRTARALEALVLQRAGLRDSLFIAMSNYYYDEKRNYLSALSAVGASDHDLTAFLKFGLRGISMQTERLYQAIRQEVSRQLFRNLMHDLFTRLESSRKRVIVKRQLTLLEKLLNTDGKIEFPQLVESLKDIYISRKSSVLAIARDLNRLQELGAVKIEVDDPSSKNPIYYISVRLDWPSKITETEFFRRLEQLPKSKTYGFLSPSEP